MKRLAFTILWSTILFVATAHLRKRDPIRVLLLDGQSAGRLSQLATDNARIEKGAGRLRTVSGHGRDLPYSPMATSAASDPSSANIR